MQAAVGPGALGGDRLQWAVDCGRAHGVAVHAWFEYGLIAAYCGNCTGGAGGATSPFAAYAAAQGWILGAADGFLWMNPDKDTGAAVTFLGKLMADAVAGYPDLAGVQLDDHFCLPVALAGSSVAEAAMTNAAKRISTQLRGALDSGRKVLSLAPAPLDLARKKYGVNWQVWISSSDSAPPLFDELVPQLYQSTSADFAPLLSATLADVAAAPGAGTGVTFAAGIRGDGAGDPTAWAELQGMLDAVKQSPGASVCLWYSKGALERYKAQLTARWRPRPHGGLTAATAACQHVACRTCVDERGGTTCLSACAGCGSACSSCIANGSGAACATAACG